MIILLYPSLAGANPLDVKADSTYYDVNTGLYMLDGNVTVRVKDAVIQAPMARVSLATLEVYAEGGISVVQGDTHFYGDSVLLKGKEHCAAIQGNITMQDNGLTFTCSNADFDWQTKDVILKNVTITDSSGQKYAEQAVYNIRRKSISY
jgi:lipopolysaccharide assembly outer membrane protein LptD (OstA)